MARGRAINGSGTIVTHKGRKKPYQIQFTVDGERKSGGYYSSYPEAAAALRDLTSQVDKQEYVEPQKMTVEQWLNIWLDTYTKHIKPGTLIFHSLHKNGRYKNITHVAVYAGNGKVVEAANPRRGVVYRSAYTPGRGRIVLCANPMKGA